MKSDWRTIDTRPPMREDYGSFTYSDYVLMTDGKTIHLGYLEIWEDEQDVLIWKQDGPDGYIIYNVTHWMPLPDNP